MCNRPSLLARRVTLPGDRTPSRATGHVNSVTPVKHTDTSQHKAHSTLSQTKGSVSLSTSQPKGQTAQSNGPSTPARPAAVPTSKQMP